MAWNRMDFAFYAIIILISCSRSSQAILHGNLSMPEMSLDFSGLNSDEMESELSSQLQEIDGRSNGWSPWSLWSPCSRSCDGGVTHQLRTCKIGPCRGDHVRYKICNMQSFAALFAILAVANAGVLVSPSAKIIQGPSSKTTVVGADGSSISSVQPGGSIVHEESVGVVAETAPVVAAAPAVAYSVPQTVVSGYSANYAAPVLSAYSAPVVSAYSAPSVVSAYSAPVVSAYSAPSVVSGYSGPVVSAYSAPVVSAYSAPSVVSAYSAPVAYSGVVGHSSVDTVVSGPSGTIVSGKSVATPVVAHAASPLVQAW